MLILFSCPFYSRFVFSLIHPGYEDLEGTEVETIIKFKKALGLNDIDAANVHMEVVPQDLGPFISNCLPQIFLLL